MPVKYESRMNDEGAIDPRVFVAPLPLSKIPFRELEKDPYGASNMVYHRASDQRFPIPEEYYLRLFPSEVPKQKMTIQERFEAVERGIQFVEEPDEEEMPDAEDNIFNMSAEDIAKARMEVRQ